MAKIENADQAVAAVRELLPKWQRERQRLDRIDSWARFDHDPPHKPRHSTTEYKELAARAQAPWGDLIVTSVAQTLYVEGYRRPSEPTNGSGWRIWQANGMDARQIEINRAALTYGLSYASVLPGADALTGEPTPQIRGLSPREMLALYDDPTIDEWPAVAIRVFVKGGNYRVDVYDDDAVWHLRLPTLGGAPEIATEPEAHDVGVPPIVRFRNRFDLEGRATGEVEPVIPLLGRIDQTSFDRLVVQRFASWVVRTIAGMSVADSAAVAAGRDPGSGATAAEVAATKLRLKVEDFLVSEDPDAKFGSLPASSLDGFIAAKKSDLEELGAVTQTPAFELLGQMANMSAEALAAAKSSQTAKSDERKHVLGEDYEQMFRLAAHVAGDTEGARDVEAQVRWADTSVRSIAQAVDAFGKLATMLGYPAELLWAKVPGMTQQDIEEARGFIAERAGAEADAEAARAAATLKAQADAEAAAAAARAAAL